MQGLNSDNERNQASKVALKGCSRGDHIAVPSAMSAVLWMDVSDHNKSAPQMCLYLLGHLTLLPIVVMTTNLTWFCWRFDILHIWIWLSITYTYYQRQIQRGARGCADPMLDPGSTPDCWLYSHETWTKLYNYWLCCSEFVYSADLLNANSFNNSR